MVGLVGKLNVVIEDSHRGIPAHRVGVLGFVDRVIYFYGRDIAAHLHIAPELVPVDVIEQIRTLVHVSAVYGRFAGIVGHICIDTSKCFLEMYQRFRLDRGRCLRTTRNTQTIGYYHRDHHRLLLGLWLR